uniref:Uncharacterized protein n=1 Tax=Cavia porcellus TaxID=10141 RepID=H0WA90_CAVPO
MASLRHHRVPCIRAALSTTWAGATGFRKLRRNTHRHLQVARRRELMDLAEAIWREPKAGTPTMAVPEVSDVDMQAEGEEPPEAGRHLSCRARGPRPPPRLGGERDKGPKLALSKRKLELLLVEPEKRKRKK